MSESRGSSLNLLTETLEANLTAEQVTTVKEIGYTIGTTGLALSDAALLARTTIEELDRWSKEVPEIRTYFRYKTVQYKKNLLRVINDQATENKDVKQAMWLLEQHFSEDYSPSVKREIEKAKRAGGDGDDVFEMAMRLIREQGSEGSPVNPKQQEKNENKRKQFSSVEEILS